MTVKIQIVLSPDEADMLKKEAERQDRKVSQMGRKLIMDGLRNSGSHIVSVSDIKLLGAFDTIESRKRP